MLVHIKNKVILQCLVLCTAIFYMDINNINCLNGCTTMVFTLMTYLVSTSVAFAYQGLTRRVGLW